jgi:bifunctional NMN adenylyltransferase/nudix hydrolase
MAQLRVGVIVGRFQVPELHAGHRQLLRAAAATSDRVVVLLGVSPLDGYVCENPLTYTQRTSLFKGFPDIILLPLMNQISDKDWSLSLDNLILGVAPLANVTLYGGRDSFASSYCGTFKVETLSFADSIDIQGTQSRIAIKESQDPIFFQGQIYSLLHQHPHAYPTVDIALVKGEEILLIQRTDTSLWVLPGGFVDPSDRSLELAAKRELSEETGLTPGGRAKYVTSMLIDDWRYRGTRDKIMTTLFMLEYTFGRPIPNPLEVQDFKWLHLESAHEIIADHHLPLIQALRA